MGARVESVFAALARYPFKPYGRYGVPPAKLDRWFVDRLRARGLTGRLEILESPPAAALLRRVQVESRIFGFGVGEVRVIASPEPYRTSARACYRLLRKVLRAARIAGFRLLRCDAVNEHTALIHTLGRLGFRPVDASLILSVDLRRLELYGNNPVPVRRAELRDLGPACDLAAEVLTRTGATRYTRDPLLRAKAAEACRACMQEAFEGRTADAIFLAGRRPVGFVTARLPDEETSLRLGLRVGRLPLSGVSAKHQGRGVYSALLDHALTWLKANGAQHAEVAAPIGCAPLQAAWFHRGARVVQAYQTFHLSLSSSKPDGDEFE